MHTELSAALNKSDNKTENNTISSRLLVLLLVLSFLAAAAAAIVPGVSSVCLCRCGGWWQALVKELAWQHPTGSGRCARCKSHTDQIHTNTTQKNTPMKTLPCCCFSFFFLWFCFSTLFYHFVAHTFFPPVLWMCGVSHQEKHSETVAVLYKCSRKNSGKVT